LGELQNACEFIETRGAPAIPVVENPRRTGEGTRVFRITIRNFVTLPRSYSSGTLINCVTDVYGKAAEDQVGADATSPFVAVKIV
jgi:hypothetical protein